MNWAAGEANDSIVQLEYGDFSVQQDLTQSDVNVTLRQPSGLVVSFNELETAVQITWNKIASAAGFKIIRDYGLAGQTTVYDGDLTNIIDNTTTQSYIDNIGDNLEHSYIILAKDADPEDNSEYSTAESGKGWSIVATNINISGYASQSITTVEYGFDYTANITSIAGGKGGIATTNNAGNSYGAKGLNYVYSDEGTGAHIFSFYSGAAGGNAAATGDTSAVAGAGGAGFNSGGNGGLNYLSGVDGTRIAAGGGGGASVFKIDNISLCGASGGNGGSGYTTASLGIAGYEVVYGPGGGGGIPSGLSSGASVNTSYPFTFGSTSTNAAVGHVQATITWKE